MVLPAAFHASRSACRPHLVRAIRLAHAQDTSTAQRVLRTGGRSVISLEGRDALSYLQGQTTNDVELLSDGGLQFSMFLNPKGRVMADVFLYRMSPTHVVVDCDTTMADWLQAYLRRYKLRSKFEMTDATDLFEPCAVVDVDTPPAGSVCGADDPRLVRRSFTESPLTLPAGGGVLSLRRHLLERAQAPVEEAERQQQEAAYLSLRLRLGLSEGVVDHAPERALPLQCNLDFMNGVSYTKGCYVGQELTARTHHTGVIRKRIVPLALAGEASAASLDGTDIIVAATGKKVGSILSHTAAPGFALAAVRLAHAGEELALAHGDARVDNVTAVVQWPAWWPASAITAAQGPSGLD